jgi:hypothetical protein
MPYLSREVSAEIHVRGLDGRSRLAYSRKQAAEALGMSLRHFQRHVQPHLRCVYSGQLRLYPRSELECGHWGIVLANCQRTSAI